MAVPSRLADGQEPDGDPFFGAPQAFTALVFTEEELPEEIRTEPRTLLAALFAPAARATLFMKLREKALALYESGHTDAEILDALWGCSQMRRFTNNIVKVDEGCPPPVWQAVAKVLKPGMLRDTLRSHPCHYTIIQDKPLVFRVHPNQPVAACPWPAWAPDA